MRHRNWKRAWRRGRAGTAPLVAGVLALALGRPPAAAGDDVQIDGILHVRNGSAPSDGCDTLHLREIWRAGGPGDDEMLFGLVSDIAADEDGNVYVLDAQLCQVHVYSPAGELVRTLFREGEGPGETRDPRDLVMLPGGNVGVVQEFPGKIIMVDRQGVPAGTITPGGEKPTEGGWVSLTTATCGGGNLVLAGTRPLPNERPRTQLRAHFLASYSLEGKELAPYVEEQHLRDFDHFVLSERHDAPPFWWATAVGADGRVYTVPHGERYAISVFAADGTLERVIEREFELWRRTPAESERVRLLYESAMGGISIPYTIDIEEYEPAISYWHRALRVAGDGSLWVVTSRGIREQPPGIMLTYDVFDTAGRFTRQVAVACEGDGVDDALFFVDDDRVVLVKGYLDALAAQFGRGTAFTADGEEHPVPEIVCYRID